MFTMFCWLNRYSMLQSRSTNSLTGRDVLVPNDEHFNSCSLSLSVPSCRALPHSHFLMILDGWPRSARYHRQKSVHVLVTKLSLEELREYIPKFGYHETPLKSSCKPFFSSCRCPLLYRVTPSGKWKRRIGLSFFLLSRQTTCRGLALGVPFRESTY